MYFELFVEGRIGLDHVAFHWKSEIEGSDHTIYFTVTVGM